MKDVMLDLEFLGKPPAARIATIGAVFFNPVTGERGKEFYALVAWANDNCPADLPMRPSTVQWWLEQDAEATLEITRKDGRITLFDALTGLAHFIGVGGVNVWGNGDDCDCVILDSAYAACGLTTPWKFYETRDVRTIAEMLYRTHGIKARDLVPFTGTPHHALHDAIHQADYVSAAWQTMMPQ